MEKNPINRYSRQERFIPIGAKGQVKLKESKVVVLGAGALGSTIINHLVRAGVGYIRIVDRDFVELSNLNRQLLYDEDDAKAYMPKVEAAKKKAEAINSEVEIDAVIADITSSNIESFVSGMDIILDGSDNFELRFLINDAAVKQGIPWIYGACISSQGLSYAIIPGKTPCLQCIMPNPPKPGQLATCDTAGIIGPAAVISASVQSAKALKLLVTRDYEAKQSMVSFDVWSEEYKTLDLIEKRDSCPCCAGKNFTFLDAPSSFQITSLCGRNSVQFSSREKPVSLPELEKKLNTIGTTEFNGFFLKAAIDEYEFSIFPDGRVILKGTNDTTKARSLYAQYLGM